MTQSYSALASVASTRLRADRLPVDADYPTSGGDVPGRFTGFALHGTSSLGRGGSGARRWPCKLGEVTIKALSSPFVDRASEFTHQLSRLPFHESTDLARMPRSILLPARCSVDTIHRLFAL